MTFDVSYKMYAQSKTTIAALKKSPSENPKQAPATAAPKAASPANQRYLPQDEKSLLVRNTNAVKPPNKVSGEGDGEAPVKVCDSCGELCAISAKECEACGAAFPEPKKKDLKLRDVDILGLDPRTMPHRNVHQWNKDQRFCNHIET